MKKHVETFDYAGTICKEMKKGILLTTKVDDKVNTMTIGWGKIGIEWGKPIFIAYVRESRYTKTMLEQSGEFTVNIPMGELDKKILAYCGTKSGRNSVFIMNPFIFQNGTYINATLYRIFKKSKWNTQND